MKDCQKKPVFSKIYLGYSIISFVQFFLFVFLGKAKYIGSERRIRIFLCLSIYYFVTCSYLVIVGRGKFFSRSSKGVLQEP